MKNLFTIWKTNFVVSFLKIYVILLLFILVSSGNSVFAQYSNSKTFVNEVDGYTVELDNSWIQRDSENFYFEKMGYQQTLFFYEIEMPKNVDLLKLLQKIIKEQCLNTEQCENRTIDYTDSCNSDIDCSVRGSYHYEITRTTQYQTIDYVYELRGIVNEDRLLVGVTFWDNPEMYFDTSGYKIKFINSELSIPDSKIEQTVSEKNNQIQNQNYDSNPQLGGNDFGIIAIFVMIIGIVGAIVIYFRFIKKKKYVPDTIDDFKISVDNSKPETSSIDLEWTSPNDNGWKILDYHIQYKTQNDVEWAVSVSDKTKTRIELKKGFKYQLRIASKNEVGMSQFSQIKEKFVTSTLLDKYQQKAVSFKSENALMVTAGPGSGKTRVVAERVKDLILNQGISPEKILCMTYSKAGMNAMGERLMEDVDLKNNGVSFNPNQVRTIHSLCFQYLQLRGETFSLKTTNDNDQTEEYSKLGEKWKNIFTKNHDKFFFSELENNLEGLDQLIDAVSAFKRENRSIEDLQKYCDENTSDDLYSKKLQDLLKYWYQYEGFLKEIYSRDFDDMLQKTVNQFNQEEFLRIFGEVDYLIIDEFQDNNYLQFEIIKKIRPKGGLTVVGDKNQSIYSFQGANIELYDNFREHYKNFKSVNLELNYRSTPQIVEASNLFLESIYDPEKNQSSEIFKYKTNNKDSSPVHIVNCENMENELEFIVKLIATNINKKTNRNHEKIKKNTFSDFAILTRTNEARLDIRRKLVTLGIPCKSKNYTTIEYKDSRITKFLSKILDRYDLRIQNLTSELEEKISEDIWKDDNAASQIFSSLELDFDQELDLDEKNSKWSGEFLVDVLYSLVSEFINTVGDRKISDFIDYIKEPNKDDKNKNWKLIDNAVEVKTAHSSKGEEFPYVIVPRSVDNHYPLGFIERELRVPTKLKQYKTDSDDKESHSAEEYRLYYVAITRAKEELFLTNSIKGENPEECNQTKFLNIIKGLSYLGTSKYVEISNVSKNDLELIYSPEESEQFTTGSEGDDSEYQNNESKLQDNDSEIPISDISNSVHEVFLKDFLKPEKEIRVGSPWISIRFLEEFLELSKNGIKIRIITASEKFAPSNIYCLKFLEKNQNQNLKYIAGDNIHFKTFIKDDTMAVDGSANFTVTGLFNQENNINVYYNKEQVKNKIDLFEKVWNRTE